MKRPWMPLYIADWRNNQHVRQMSRAARSFYLDMLLEIWSQGPLPDDHKKVARILGDDPRTIKAVWSEIRPRFAVDSDGNLTHNRVESELNRARIGRDRSGKSSEGNKTEPENTPSYRSDSDTDNTTSDKKEHRPAAAPLVLAPSESTKRFDLEAIYSEYPRKVGKTPGLAKLAKQIKTDADYETAMRGVVAFAVAMQAEGRPLEKIPYFSSWVNQGQWRDYADMPATGQRTADRPGYKVPRAHFEETTDEDLTK